MVELSSETKQKNMSYVLGRAEGLVVDTGLVELEGVVAGIDGDGDGADGGNGGLEGSLGSGGDINELGQSATGVGSVVVAGAITSSVGVLSIVRDAFYKNKNTYRSLGVKTLVLDDVGESVVHQTSVASLVALAGGAVDEVLLGEGDELAGGLEVGALEGASGGERPARAALSLILDGGHVSLGNPVDGGGVSLVALSEGLAGNAGSGVHLGGQVDGLELGVGQVTELVHSELVRVSLGVVGVDVSKVLVEDGLTAGLLLLEG